MPHEYFSASVDFEEEIPEAMGRENSNRATRRWFATKANKMEGPQ